MMVHLKESCVTFLWLVGGEVTGWCYRNLVLNMKIPSSTWVPAEEHKDIVILLYVSLQKDLTTALLYFVSLLVLSCHGHVGS